MNRNHIYSLWVFLLCLFPALTCAQTLSRYQYWFDDNFSAKMTKSLSGKEREINVGLDVQQLEDGIHKFSFRVRQSDGMYSAVTSSLFMKTTPGEATLLEYWIDGDISTSKTIDCQSVSAGGYMVNDYLDLSDVEPGVHRLFLRGRSADSKVVSAITSVPILVKRPMPEGNKVIYWIDDNIDQQESVSFDSSAEVNSLDLDLSDYAKYPVGFHRLNMKLSLEGQGESTILSDGFFKAPTGEATRLEFWLDGDFKNTRKNYAASLSGSNYIFNKTLDLNNLLANVPAGVHRLFIRGRSSDNRVASAVTSVPVLVKRPMPEGNKVIYWIDDNVDQQTSVSFDRSTEVNSLDLDLADYAKYPVGFHRLNMKLSLEGQGESAILSDGFFKTPTGAATRMEYWLDGDYKNSHKNFAGTEQNGEYIFNRTLSLSNVTPGAHRLFIRGRSSDNRVASAISSMPIMVKSRYSNMNPADVTMKRYSVSVDNEEPVTVKFGTPDFDVTLDRDVDLHDLSTGTHTLKTKFWNSFGAGVGLEQQFTIKEPETPVINLSVTEKDGIVLLRYDIPANQKNYRLQRKDANGAKHTIFRDEVFRGWEVSDWWNDTPEAGSYTYYVESVYYDSEGNHHLLKSNEVSVNIAKAQEDLNNCGYITGRIVPTYGAADFHDIVFSDGVKTRTSNNFFERQMIPAGTTLTISVIGNSHEEFETATITIKPGENHVRLKDLNITEFESKPNNYYSDLDFSSDLEWVGNSYQFSVRNTTRNTWSGYVRLRIISKDKVQKDEDGETTDPSEEEEYDEITPGLRAEDNYVYVFSDEIKNLQSGQSTMVSLSLDNVFAPDKKDWYYIYFESIGKWNSDPKGSEKVKIIGIDRDYSITENPMLRQVDKSTLAKAQEKILMQDAEYAANIILACCGYLKQFNGIIGDVEQMGEIMAEKGKKMKDIDMAKLNTYIENALETETAEEFANDEMVQAFLSAVYGNAALILVQEFRDKIADEIFKYAGGVKKYLGEAMKYLKYIREYREWEKMNNYDRFFYCADAILDAADKYPTNPMCSILKTYSKVARSFIQKALEYGEAYYKVNEVSLLQENIPSENDKPRYEYNRHVDFKIKVRTNRLVYFNFAHFGTHPIREVVVKAQNNSSDADAVATIHFDLVPVWDGVMLRQTSMDNGTVDYKILDEGTPIGRMWMEIKWKNGRTTKVPLRDDIDGVDFDGSSIIQNTKQYTVYLQSGTTKFDNMADIIEVKE